MKLQWKMLRRGQNSEIEGIIKFMKEQCIRYDNILTNSKVRIRTDLIEKTTELKRCMQKEDMDEEQFQEYLEEQRLTGILLVDKDLEIIQNICTEKIPTSLWKNAFRNQNLQNVFSYKNRVLTDQIVTDEEETYYYTAMSDGDADKIVVCYENASKKAEQEDEVSIETILTGYFAERGMVMTYAVCLYLAFWFILLEIRRRGEKRRRDDLEYQHNIINAISKIYMTNYVVDLKKNKFEIIRAPEIVSKVAKNFKTASEIVDAVTEYFVGKDYQEGMREVTELSTISDRLRGKEALNYTFKDRGGTWFMLNVLPKRILPNREIESVIFTVQDEP